MLGFITNNPVSTFIGNQVSDVIGWFSKKNEEHETVENLRTGKQSRLLATNIVLKKLAEDDLISKENFFAGKVIIEDVCGITNLTYDELKCEVIDGGVTLEMAGKQPKITVYKADALTKEELLQLYPDLKNIQIRVKSKEEPKPEEVKPEEKHAEVKESSDKKEEVKKETPKSSEKKTEEKPKTEVKQETKKEEKIDPEAPANIGLKTDEELKAEKVKVVEIKKDIPKPEVKKEDPKPVPQEKKEPVKQEEVKVDPKREETVKPAEPVKKEEEKQKQQPPSTATTTDTKKDVMVTYADTIKDNFSKFESDIFDKVIKKWEKGKEDGKVTSDIKLTQCLVKRCDKENKLVTFLFVNDNKVCPLIEVFYHTSNNVQSMESYSSANELITALKKRKEDAKTDKNLVKKCYNIKYSTIPGYVEPAKQ